MPVDFDVVIVGDPTGDLPWSAVEAHLLAQRLYPDAVMLGRGQNNDVLAADLTDDPGIEQTAGTWSPATAQAVLERLPRPGCPGSTLFHLGCHARLGSSPEFSHLQLVPDAQAPDGLLQVSRILLQAQGREPTAPGPLVVLSSCSSDVAGDVEDEALTLATAFVAAGATGVVGSRWDLSDRLTFLLMLAFHHYLDRGRVPPAEALRLTQLWAMNTRREALRTMPSEALADVTNYTEELAQPTTWAAFGYHGR